MSLNHLNMIVDKPIIQISSEVLVSVYPTEGYFTARLEIENLTAIGNSIENSIENLIASLNVSIMEWHQTNQLEEILMKYGWSAEIHDNGSVLYIQPPMKIKIKKAEYNLSEDDLEIVETIESVEEMKKILEIL
jgi:hypothetical protein